MILKGKNAVVTGATSGLGLEIVKKLLENECNVYMFSSNESKLQDVKKQLKNKFQESLIEGCVCDFSKECNKIENIVINIETIFNNKIDFLFNNAGIFQIKDIMEVTSEEYEKFMNVNVKSSFLLTKYVSRNMIQNREGKIINIGSSSCYNGSCDTGIYSITKHAILGMSRSFYLGLKKYGIKVYCISPASLKTNMGKEDYRQDYDTFLDPQEVAEYIVFIVKTNSNLILEEVRMNRMIVK